MNIGKEGEKTAEIFLKRKGFRIIETNFSCNFGEIDIIAKRKDVMHFIEVKTRSSRNYGSPIEAVTPYKVRHIVKTVQFYILIKQLEGMEVSLDVIEIEVVEGRKYINHIENAIIL